MLSDFKPQWHHIYPRKFLKDQVDDALVDALSNIAVIGPEINIRISAKDPLKYLDKYEITNDKLRQQFIDQPRDQFSITAFDAFLKRRSAALALAANQMLLELSQGLQESVRPLVGVEGSART